VKQESASSVLQPWEWHSANTTGASKRNTNLKGEYNPA
jgi:hypothetical protein